MKETEIGTAIVEFFTAPAHEVFCEVPCAGIIDVVVKCGPIITAIECKCSFGLSVIEQAYKNLNYSHYSYVAVPRATSWFARDLCKRFGIGILVVDFDSGVANVHEYLAPAFRRKVHVPKLPEFCKLNKAGVQNDRWTAFSWFVDNVKKQLRRAPDGLTHKELFHAVEKHYKTPSSLNACMQTYIRQGVITGIEYRDKRFFIAKP